MSRVLWHSVVPWAGSGYGQQTAMFTPRIRDLGHDVALSAFWGLGGSVMGWRDMPVFPFDEQWGNRSLPLYAQMHKADCVITLMDVWVLQAKKMKDLPLACWVPIDQDPAPPKVIKFLKESGAKPIAMSRFGERMLKDEDLDPLYVPHGCFDYDARVVLPHGGTVKLGDIVMDDRSSDEVLGVDTSGHLCRARVLRRHRLPLGDSHALSVVTRSGRRMVITRDNEVLTERGWRRAGDLAVSDVVATVNVHGGNQTSTQLEPGGDCLAPGQLPDGDEGRHPGAVRRSDVGGHSAACEQGAASLSPRLDCVRTDRNDAQGTDAGGVGLLRRSDRRGGPHQSDPQQSPEWLRALHAEGWAHEPIGSVDPVGRRTDRVDGAVGGTEQGRVGMGVPPGDHGSSGGPLAPAPSAVPSYQRAPSGVAAGVLCSPSGATVQLASGRTRRAHLSPDEKPERAPALTFDPIVSITPVWLEEVYDLTTSTGNFVVDGIVVHNCDTSVMRPKPENRARTREKMGFPEDAFVIGMVAANTGNLPARKAFPQVIQAFAAFRKDHPDAYLYMHTEPTGTGTKAGLFIPHLASQCGLEEDQVRFTNELQYEFGLKPSELADMYNAFDVLASPSYGEGFGIPIVESQSCGTPVIVTDWTAMTELCGDGWMVGGDPWFNAPQGSFYKSPSVDEIVLAFEAAYEQRGQGPSQDAREFALQYDADRVMKKYWVPALARLGVSMSALKAAA